MFPKLSFLGTPTDTYALCLLASFIIVFIGVLIFKPEEFPLRYVFWGAVIFFIFASIGAMLWNVGVYSPQYKGYNIKQVFLTAGVSYLGAPILGFFALWIYLRLIRIPFLLVADYIAPFVMLERLIGRIGCLGHGCCYGIPSNLPWAYPFNVWGITQLIPRHPTQAYAVIYALAILISSCYLYNKTKNLRAIPKPEGWEKRPLEERKQLIREAPSAGIIFFYVFFWYGVLRFFNEFLRAEGPFLYGQIKISHIILFIFMVISAAGLVTTLKKATAKADMLKALKGALLRLAAWLVVSAVVILSAITLHILF